MKYGNCLTGAMLLLWTKRSENPRLLLKARPGTKVPHFMVKSDTGVHHYRTERDLLPWPLCVRRKVPDRPDRRRVCETMNEFLEELLELCLKRLDASRSSFERKNWNRLANKVESIRGFGRSDNLLYRYALWGRMDAEQQKPVPHRNHQKKPQNPTANGREEEDAPELPPCEDDPHKQPQRQGVRGLDLEKTKHI